MWKILQYVKDRLVWFLPVSMVLGLILGSQVDVSSLKSSILPLTMLMVLPMMVNLEWRSLFSREGGKGFLAAQGINFLVVPFIAYGIGRLIFPDNSAAVAGMVLIGSLPTSGMTLSWTGFAKGNVKGALRNVLSSLLLGALLLPLYLRLFLGESSGIPVGRLFQQIGTVILVPMLVGGILGTILRSRLGQEGFRKSVKPKMPLVSSGAVVLMVFVAMALKARSIISSPEAILRSLLALILFYGLLFTLNHLLGRYFLKRVDALALVFSTAVRNLSIALALSLFLLGDRGGPASLLASLAFLVQVQAAAWYVRLEGRNSGQLDTDSKAASLTV